jgi:glucose-6-phosphate isomerase
MSLPDIEIMPAFSEFTVQLGDYQRAVDTALAEMSTNNIVGRIWAHDHTVWQDDPTEISNRLGWLRIAELISQNQTELEALVASVKASGYTDVLLLGMGGSSLAPEVFANTFGDDSDGLNLSVLDSTDADLVAYFSESLDPATTLFIVATKSGGTAETLSGFKHFYNWTRATLGEKNAGKHFIGITDPGSKLIDLANEYNFRALFINDPNIGGRYSVLSYFGMVPAALIGVDVPALLHSAMRMMDNNRLPVSQNMGAQLGAIMGELAKAGRDKVTFITDEALANWSDWAEQLIAESTGKNGKGILPVVGETLSAPDSYGNDRLFVHIKLAGNHEHEKALAALVETGHPLITIQLNQPTDMGGQFQLWEFATAVAGYRLGIQPFNQPNVESAKVSARKVITEYEETGELPDAETGEIGEMPAFIAQASPGDYIAIHAYLTPTSQTTRALDRLRLALRDHTKLAVTVGYGPRFLHSTGQLHKGDAGNGLFLQLTDDAIATIPIPDNAGKDASAMDFDTLKLAQAIGDYNALREADPPRRALHLHLEGDVAEVISGLAKSLQ